MQRHSQAWDPDTYEFVAQEAAHLGISAAEFIRTAALARAAFAYARRDPHGSGAWTEPGGLYDQAGAVLRRLG